MDVILSGFKTTLTKITTTGNYNRETGEYEQVLGDEVNFTGAVLPLSADDLIKNEDSGYTRQDKKVYTDFVLENNNQIRYNNQIWKVQDVLDYSYINNSFKRYVIRMVGDISD